MTKQFYLSTKNAIINKILFTGLLLILKQFFIDNALSISIMNFIISILFGYRCFIIQLPKGRDSVSVLLCPLFLNRKRCVPE